jgi:ABC-2 type transport system permease protein
VSRLAVRQLRLGAVVVALVCGVMSALAASQYKPISDILDTSALRALSENPAIRILSGPPVALDDPGGFTVWRTGPPLSILASLWMTIAATGLTRGEEDARRWDLLLSGRLRMTDVLLRCLAALLGSAALIGLAVGVGLVAAGTQPIGAVVHAAGMAGVAMTFATAALLAAQVMPTRAGATALAAAILGIGVLLRMVADGAHRLAWLAWTTPFGLTSRAAPYADNRILPLIVLSAFPIALGGAALLAAGYRDVGDGLVPLRRGRRPRTRLLHSVFGFALRRAGRITLWWAAGIAVYFFLVGTTLAWLLELFRTNQRFSDVAAAAGLGGHNLANVFAAALFSLLAVVTGMYAASRLGAMVADEKTGRSTLLFAQPLSRVRLLLTEVLATSCGVVLLHCAAALAIWGGAQSTGAPLQIGDSFAGAMNSVPVSLLAVAMAAVGVGWIPSATIAVGALPVLAGFFVNLVIQTSKAPHWLANLSPLSHLAAVPDAGPNVGATAVFLLIAAILAAVAARGYAQRDLTA